MSLYSGGNVLSVSNGISGDVGVKLGCLSKALTAMLVEDVFDDAGIDLDATAASFVPALANCSLAEHAGAIIVSHLLTHTHGLDDAYLVRLPTSELSNCSSLVRALCKHEPLSQPGLQFSYGNGGAALAAYAAEQVSGRSLEALLIEKILDPAQIDSAADTFSPAHNGEHVLSSLELLAAIATRLENGKCERSVRRRRVSFPGWSPDKKFAVHGWFDYGDDWFGQTSVYGGQSVIVRFNVAQRRVLTITSTSERAFWLFSQFFGRELPEFRSRRNPPAPQSVDQREGCAFENHMGTFVNSASSIDVREKCAGKLEFHVRSPGRPDKLFTTLRASQDSIFFLEPPDRNLFFLQLLSMPGQSQADYLWNGRQLWRHVRIAGSVHAV